MKDSCFSLLIDFFTVRSGSSGSTSIVSDIAGPKDAASDVEDELIGQSVAAGSHADASIVEDGHEEIGQVHDSDMQDDVKSQSVQDTAQGVLLC